MTFNKSNKLILVSLAIFSLAAGLGIGIFIHNFDKSCDHSRLRYINKDFVCEGIIVQKHSYTTLKHNLENFIRDAQKEGKVDDVAIYFRDLQDGPTMGINEHSLFIPASLLKLPLFLAYQDLKNDEMPDLFDRQIVAKNNEDDFYQTISPRESVKYGNTYSVGDLLKIMIRYSDNRAAYILADYLEEISPNRNRFEDTLVSLGIINPKGSLEDSISVKAYGSIFVQLYNNSYFGNSTISNNALELLTQADWNGGIPAGIPAGMKIAHKFGERGNDSQDIFQLHDCGIVFYPENPYLLCIMTHGHTDSTLADLISSISKMVYEEFNSRRMNRPVF